MTGALGARADLAAVDAAVTGVRQVRRWSSVGVASGCSDLGIVRQSEDEVWVCGHGCVLVVLLWKRW